MRKRGSRGILLAVLSFASPLIAFALMNLYQGYAYGDFWASVSRSDDDAAHTAGAMMGFANVLQILFSTGIGCVIGAVLALFSLRKNWQFFSLGTAALIFNLAPFLFFAFLLIT